jgi:hypothetical protein
VSDTHLSGGRAERAPTGRRAAGTVIVLLLLGGTAPAATAGITFVGAASTSGSSPVSSISLTQPAGQTVGDVMLAQLAIRGGSGVAVTQVPAGWTLVLRTDNGTTLTQFVYWKAVTNSESAPYVWTISSSQRVSAVIAEYSGVSTSGPIDAAAGQAATPSPSSYSAPSVTTTAANDEVIRLYATANGNATFSSVPATERLGGTIGTSSGPNGVIVDLGSVTQAAAGASGAQTASVSSSSASIGQTVALIEGPFATPDHFAVGYPGGTSAVNCQAQPVTISAHSATHAAVATTGTITVSTSTGHGDWTLSSGGGTFVAGASNSGSGSYSYAAADDGVVTLLLRDTYAETVTINAADGSVTQQTGTALASEQQTLAFSASGFRITDGSNTPTTIGTQVAGKTSTQSLALQAVRTDINTGACAAVFASGATVNVSLAYQCNDPTSCVAGQAFTVTNNGTTTGLASNPNNGVTTYTAVPLRFSTANGEAPFSLNYTDVGKVTLYASYNIPLGSGSGSGRLMTGSGQFVVQPAGFTLSGITCTAYGVGSCNTGLGPPGNNPAAASATGAVFLPAGQSFSATVAAVNYEGAATPNYGREISPETVRLTANLVLPTGGHAAALNNPTAFGAFSGGVATGTTFNWPEVGIITLTPSVGDGSYLGTGDVSGATSGNVGRFIPASFGTNQNMPVLGTGCTAGSFSYLGQPLTFTVAPVLTVTARSADGATTTQNYTGAFLKLTNGTLTGRLYTSTPASPALDMSGLPAPTVDPAIVDLGGGQATLTFSAGDGIKFVRGAAVAPFSANIALAINVIDGDGVTATNPVIFGSGSGISFSAGATQRYGRLFLKNAAGSELLDLPMALTTQYYLNSSQGFVTNTDDACTLAPALAFSSYQLNLSAGETCVRDAGSPGVSGQGCVVAADASLRYRATAAAGDFNLLLAAPGSGNSGALTVTAVAPAWLRYLWNAGSGVSSSPSGMATFGVFPGPASRIYQREVY